MVKTATSIDQYTAARIAEAMNCWAGKENRRQVITAEEVQEMTPLPTSEADGYLVYGYQWGDVTILACVWRNGNISVKHACW